MPLSQYTLLHRGYQHLYNPSLAVVLRLIISVLPMCLHSSQPTRRTVSRHTWLDFVSGSPWYKKWVWITWTVLLRDCFRIHARTSRHDFWIAYLGLWIFALIGGFVFHFPFALLFSLDRVDIERIVVPFNVWLAVALITLVIRRIHDVGLSGWALLIPPLLGLTWLVLILIPLDYIEHIARINIFLDVLLTVVGMTPIIVGLAWPIVVCFWKSDPAINWWGFPAPIDTVRHGDLVVTADGMIGTITGEPDKRMVSIEIAPKLQIRIARKAIYDPNNSRRSGIWNVVFPWRTKQQ